MSIYLGTTPLTGTAGQRNIGQIIQSTIPLTDAGLHLLDGSVISGNGAYSAFVTHIAGLVSGHSELFTTEANWQTSNDNYGACDKFVYDSVNNTVRLPKRVTDHGELIKSYSAGTSWYRIYADGWCEQGGNYTLSSNNSSISISFLKPFNNTNYSILVSKQVNNNYDQSVYAPKIRTRSTTGFIGTCNTDVADSLFIWQACGYTDISDLQQTPVYEYIVLANSVKTPVEVDIDEVMTDLNGKVDIADLAECSVVISRTANSLGGITEIWSDGYCVQTGQLVRTATGILNVTLDKEYINNNYIVIATNRAADTYKSASTFYPPYVLNVTTTGFSMSSNAAIANINRFTWRTEGYIR